MLSTLHRPARVALAGVTLLALAGITGLGTARAVSPERPTAAVTITDDGLTMPASVQAGYVGFSITNAGTAPHAASFVKLAPDVTPDQVSAAVQSADSPDGLAALQQLITFYGGIDPVDPGTTVSLGLKLSPGSYAVGDQGQLAMGQARLFTVTAPAGDDSAPPAAASVTLREYTFDAPATLPAGSTTIQIRNAGAQTHELVLMRLDAGHSMDELLAALQEGGPDAGQPDWVHPATSWSPAGPGVDGTVTLDLTPGTYAMLCFMPDPATGTPHAMLGMVNSFTAQ